jgi:hypothetical protein
VEAKTEKRKCSVPPSTPPCDCSSHCAAAMEATRAILRSDQKRDGDIKRVRLAIVLVEPIFTDIQRNAIFASAEALDMSGEYQEQELLRNIRQEGQGDPIHVLKMISSFISHQAVRYQKAKHRCQIHKGARESASCN